MQRIIRLHWPFAVLASLALALLLTGLGSDYLWEDEGDTAVLASNILKYGVPKAWDGVTFIDSDRGARDNDDLVMVSHPWMQVLCNGRVVPCFRRKHIQRPIALRFGRLADNSSGLFVGLAHHFQPLGRVLCSRFDGPFGSVSSLFEAMP